MKTLVVYDAMKTLVVYESLWGNTAKVAEMIADRLRPAGAVDLFDTDAAPPSAAGYDLLVVGGPTHAFSMTRPVTRKSAIEEHGAPRAPHRGIREWIEQLPTPAPSTRAAAFDTRIDSPRLPGSAAKAARHELRSLGFETSAKAQTFRSGFTATRAPCSTANWSVRPPGPARSRMAADMVAISVHDQPEQLAAVLPGRVPMEELPQFFARAFAETAAALEQQGLHPTGPPFAKYLGMPTAHVDVEAGFPVDRPFSATGELVPTTLPGGRVVEATHVGSYDTMQSTYAELESYFVSHGLPRGDVVWESYLTEPAPGSDPSQWRTRICWPVG